MPEPSSTRSDDAPAAAGHADYSLNFDEVVFRSLQPISLGLVVLYSVFFVMGFFDVHSRQTQLAVMATDGLSALLFLLLYLACRRDMIRPRWINPIGLGIACIGTGNVLLAFEYVGDPFYLTYVPMIIISYGALLLSLPWLLINAAVVVGGTLLFVGNDMPVELLARYSPALVGAVILAAIILIVRRRGVLAAQAALRAARGELESRREVERQLAHSQRLDSLGKLVSGISHEFNNLLMVIIGYADQLLDDPRQSTAETTGDLKAIRDAGERAAALAGKLLAFSRQQVMKTRVVAANEVILNARPLIERSIPGNVALRFELDDAAGHVSVDTLQMEQVLLNLGLNARDAMSASGGELAIATAATADGAAVEILVSDTGEGMRAEIRERAFEPFFTTKPHGSGTGLGLATVYGIVVQSGGTVEIESEPGEGATFRIRLPRVDAPAEVVVSGDPAQGAATQQLSGTVLVVDDEPDVRRVVCMTLEHQGCRILEADSGAAALEVAAREPFDVVLTDIVMPAMSGTELVEALRRRGHQQRVIYMSGHGAEAEASAVANGPFLRKPFRRQELVDTVAGLLKAESP